MNDAVSDVALADALAGPREYRVLCASPAGLHRMLCTEWGPADSRKVALCVHGLTRNGRDFDALARALAQEGWRVVCPDMVGRGRSDWLSEPAGYELQQYVADIVTLIARLGVEELHWVGTSMGGIIGIRLASYARTPVRSLVLNDIGPEIALGALTRLAGHVGRMPNFADLAEAEAWMRVACAPYGQLSDAQWAHLTKHSLRALDDGFELAYDPAVAQVFGTLPPGGVQFWSAYEAVRCPVLALRGEESDVLGQATLRRMASCGPKAETVEIPATGHAPMLMDAAQIGLVTDFLRKSL